jgi:hypothetical protein
MLYQLTKTALEQPGLRARLLPFIDLGRATRVASVNVDLRSVVIHAAFETNDRELRDALVRCAAAPTFVEAGAPEPDESVAMTYEEYRQLVKVAYSTTSGERRRQVLGILKQAKYSKGFMKWVEGRKFKHPDTGNDVLFVSLPAEEQKKVHQQWKAGKKEWAQKFKPDSLDDKTRLTPEKFDDLKEGEELWISWSPAKVHRVTGKDKTSTGKPVLVMVQVDPKTGKEGETRYMHKSTVSSSDHELHVMPPGSKIKLPGAKPSKAPEPEKPKAEEKKPEKPKAEEKKKKKKPAVPPAAKEALKHMVAPTSTAWMNSPGLPGPGAEFGDKKSPFSTGSTIEIEEGGYPPKKYDVMADKLVSGPNGDAMMVEDENGTPTLVPIGSKYEPKKMYELDESGKEKPKKVPESAKPVSGHDVGVGDTVYLGGEPYEVLSTKPNPDKHGQIVELKGGPDSVATLDLDGPKGQKGQAFVTKGEKPKEPEKPKAEEKKPSGTGKHKDRKELRGKGKPDSHKVKLTDDQKKSFLPDGLSAAAKAATEKGLEGADVGLLKKLQSNVKKALDEPEGAYAKAMAQSGYTPGDLSKMSATLKGALKGLEGRQYGKEVLDMANKYDLEGEDADELYDFRSDKPGFGKKLTDQQLMQKFLAKAKPETKERMKGMSVADFMVMYKAIMADEEEEEA